MTEPKLPNLHDATLKGVELDWPGRTATIRLATGPETVVLVARGLLQLSAPRREPWGPSVFVNEVALKAGSGEMRLRVEMQSGDVIEVVANSFDVS